MLGLDTIDVAIGLILVFLSASLLCTSIREIIEAVMKTRAADLERGVRELLRDPEGELTRVLYEHPLIYSLYRGAYAPPDQKRVIGRGGTLPSYIPSGQFARAILDLVSHGTWAASPYPAPAGREMSVASLRVAVAQLPNASLRRAMTAALDHADGDLRVVQANLESWFNGTMDRVSGWSKRRTQTFLFFIGLTVAVALNLDALTVVQRLSRDKALRGAVVAEAQQATGRGPDVDGLKDRLDSIGLPVGWAGGWPAPQVSLLCPGEPHPAGCVDAPPARVALRSAPSREGRFYQLGAGQILGIAVGWLVSALAVMLGAPFWFDILNKFMIVRATVKPTQKSPDEASEDRPKPAAQAAPPVAPAAPSAATAGAPPAADPVAPAPPAPPPAVPAGLPEPPISFEAHEWRAGHADPAEGDL